jgi:hypothetical protein
MNMPLSNNLRSLTHIEERLLNFQEHQASVACTYQWKFTRRDLSKLLVKLRFHDMLPRAA